MAPRMSVLPITVEDLSKIRTMAMPVPRGARTVQPSKLAPVEMQHPSVSFSGSKPAPAVPAPAPASEPCPAGPVAHGWLIPSGYACCGAVMALCNLFVPGACRECAQLICPIWSCAVLLHLATQPPTLQWLGVLVILFLPFVLMLGDPLFVAAYAVMFTLFAAGNAWSTAHGPSFIFMCVCACAAVATAVMSTASPMPHVHLSVSGFSATVCAIVCTLRLSKVGFRVC